MPPSGCYLFLVSFLRTAFSLCQRQPSALLTLLTLQVHHHTFFCLSDNAISVSAATQNVLVSAVEHSVVVHHFYKNIAECAGKYCRGCITSTSVLLNVLGNMAVMLFAETRQAWCTLPHQAATHLPRGTKNSTLVRTDHCSSHSACVEQVNLGMGAARGRMSCCIDRDANGRQAAAAVIHGLVVGRIETGQL